MRSGATMAQACAGAIAARLEEIDAPCLELRERLSGLLDARELFAAELLLRELLTNGVCHGCREDGIRQVRYEIRLDAARLSIVVEDDGDGFDWRSARRHQAEASDTSGRGMEILSRYADEVRFNDAGNRVELTRWLRGKGNSQ